MLQILPSWYTKAGTKLQNCIDDIVREHCLDWGFVHDSKAIEEGQLQIMNSLLIIAEQVQNPMFPPREKQVAFQEKWKKEQKEEKAKKKPRKIAFVGKSPGKRKPVKRAKSHSKRITR